MPAAKKSAPAAKAAPAAKTTPAKTTPKKAAKAAPAKPTADVDPPVEADENAETPEAPLNRAERRARGKGKSSTQPTTRGKVVGSHGPAQAQRMWANRRSG